MSQRKKVGILISGRGSNMAALVDAAAGPDFPAEIALVISDKPDVPGLNLAKARRVMTQVIERNGYDSKEAHDAAIHAALTAAGIEIVALAGYMRLLSPGLVNKWSGRMINIHPSLLPLFPGLDTHQKAIDAGMRISGCTVHFVTPAMDQGPIIAQTAVPIRVGETAEALASRILREEHRLYARSLAMLCEGKVEMRDGRTVFHNMQDGTGSESITSPEPQPDALDLERLARITP